MSNRDEELVRNAINATDDDTAWQAFNRILVDRDTTHQNNMGLCNAIRDYHEILTEIHRFINAYLDGGGDATVMPAHWHDLDKLRQIRYATMLQAAGLTS